MILADTFIFRIIHIDNLEFILRSGNLTNKFSEDANPDYIGIGEAELIGKRENQIVTTVDVVNEHNPSNDFLPFYFYSKSVMLYRIQTGHKVTKRAPEDIIYLIYKLDEIIDDVEYLFTDGHGYASFTGWYEDIENLLLLDIQDITREQWNNTEDDPDRMRRKQAEFWIKQPLSIDAIKGIATYDEATRVRVREMCESYQKNIEIKTKPNYYY
ncbi:DUF4433 domain-containing protein [uncultured Polaribacter sp.]|uniref:type II toxin-antitoxin system toxin DNA ADP-ribosyl transferase DarT n=1 Tax=uncultured Polaribacter sp. TaxID=174711 RepID=UPI00260AA9C6|nr:DUF4433 domain-containing protein [uncultured Polaribacter sp.]